MANADPALSPSEVPRVVVAGLAGDTGKTLISLGLVRALRIKGLRVAPFKKGPDFIDAAWLGAAADSSCSNLDTFLMPPEAILGSFATSSASAEIAVIEGNRGLFDGLDEAGTFSTAELSKLLRAPVVLVVDATKVTRTIAALVLGCQVMDEQLDLGGVILNRVGTERQQAVIRQAVEVATGVPVIGAIPRLRDQHLPSRHLGLVTASEHLTEERKEILDRVGEILSEHVDVDQIIDLAETAPPLKHHIELREEREEPCVRIGVLRDRAFSFYYPENLRALETAGAELVFISPLTDSELPPIDALYAGGGFPEEYAAELSANEGLRRALRERIEQGIPVWAECGGLMYLARTLIKGEEAHEMVGVLPITVRHETRPQGHGYVEAQVVSDNPFFAKGSKLRGHEFHYSSVIAEGDFETILSLERGTGVGDKRDGIKVGRVVASYLHVHALGTPKWASSFVKAARGEMKPAYSGVDGDHPPLLNIPQPVPHKRYRLQSTSAKRTKKKNANIRQRVRGAIEGDSETLAKLVSEEPKAIRHLLTLTYATDEKQRMSAAAAIAMAGKYHPKLVQNVIRRLVWAMNDESGTNAATAPEVLRVIAEKQPDLLLPMVPDLCRLAADSNLREGLADTLRIVSKSFPGTVSHTLQDLLNRAVTEKREN